MLLPKINDIKLLHKKYAPSQQVFEELWQHCEIVKTIAIELIDKKKLKSIDRDLVEVGCLLHDIGVYRLYNKNNQIDEQNYIRHGVIGYELLKENDFDEQLCRFAKHHTGVGLTADEIAKITYRCLQKICLPIPKKKEL